jgi:hypothetical protein
MDEIEWFIGVINSKYTAENSDEGIFIAHQQSAVLQCSNKQVPPSPTIEPLQTEPKQQEKKESNSTSAATSLVPAIGILPICSYLIFLNLPINF